MRLALLLLAACGAAGPQGASPTLSPVTDADPPPYTPGPSDVAHTGDTVALATSGGGEQARAVTVRMLQAILESDERTLSRLLSEQLAMAQPRLSNARRARSDVITRALQSPRRRSLTPDMSVDALVDLSTVQVQPLSELSVPVPASLRPGDLQVVFTFTPQGRRIMFHLLEGWRHRGVVIVRTGVEPRIVGL